MTEEPNYPSIDPELEARIVALVLGEASDFERDELHRLIDQRPELAAFKQEMQSVHGLLRDVGAGESTAENEEWKLSLEKRNAVLAAMTGETQPASQVVSKFADQRRSKRTSLLRNIGKIAAVLCVAGFFGSLLMPSRFAAREAASRIHRSIDSSGALMDAAAAPDAEILMADGATAMLEDEEPVPAAEPTTSEEPDYGISSKSALSNIRDSLAADATLPSPYYLQDDVQYFPASPELKLPQEAISSFERGAANGPMGASSAGFSGAGPDRSLRTVDGLAHIPQSVESSGTAGSNDASAWRDSSSSSSYWEFEPTTPALGVQESDQGRKLSQGQQSLRGGTNLEYSRDLFGDSPAAGNELDIAGGARNGEELGRERFRLDGRAPAGTLGEDATAERIQEEIAEGELESRHGDNDWSKTAPSKPMVARRGGRQWKAEEYSAQMDFDAVHSMPDPSNKPISSGEKLKNKKVAGGFKQESAKRRLAMPSEKEISLHDNRISGEGKSNGYQIPMPVTGTVLDQPLGELQVGQANDDRRLRDEAQPKAPQRELAEMKKNAYGAIPHDYRNGVEAYWERIPSTQKAKRDELSQRRGQPAADEQTREFGNVPPRSMVEHNIKAEPRLPISKSVVPAGLNEKTAADEAFSTFSLHVSDVSFKLARAALASGTWPEAAKVRIEEFVNAFDYGDPMPSQSEKVACRVEQSVHPFLQQRNLLRVSMRTAAAGRSSHTPLRLTFLLDNSGSMERIDRQQTVRRAFALLAEQLTPIDQVTLISFARQPRLLADKVSGAQSRQLVGLIENLPSEGGTNIEAALQLAFEKAREQRVDNAQNRIILLTDGAVNLGDANPESLSRMITTMRAAGIAFDAAGISAEGLNDEILEALTRKGDGRYYLLDSLEAADDGFARQIAGALRPSAMNVKVQIEFNPERVGRYKLLGFEKHRLKQEDFRNDKVDAAEMAAAEAGVALYQFEAKPDGQGDVGSVSVRFRDLSTGQMIENCWPIPYEPDAPRLDQAAPSLRIAASAALLAAKLRGEALGESVDLKTLSNLIAGLPTRDRNVDRIEQLQQMIGQARQVSGE